MLRAVLVGMLRDMGGSSPFPPIETVQSTLLIDSEFPQGRLHIGCLPRIESTEVRAKELACQREGDRHESGDPDVSPRWPSSQRPSQRARSTTGSEACTGSRRLTTGPAPFTLGRIGLGSATSMKRCGTTVEQAAIRTGISST
jgi:hypothetical protein